MAEETSSPALIGRYQTVRLLGRGAMGRVLLGHDPVVDRRVAIKLLRDDLTLSPEQRVALIERMRQEARASARVSHPNIVGLYDMGEHPELGLYLVFEYAEGLTLEQRIGKGPLGAEAGARLSRELGDALTTAHEAGVLHRDIKPQNIILTPTGAKIADFGIARVPDSTLTRDGGLLGTPAYSAPECITHSAFSPLSDQFSLAATLYEGLSQRRAFPGEDAVAVATRITTEPARGIAEECGLDPHVDAIVLRGLARLPGQRFTSAREFGEALSEALLSKSRRSLQATLPDELHRHAPWQKRPDSPGMRSALGGAAVGALLGVSALQLSNMLREPDAPSPDASAHKARPAPTAWLAERPVPVKKQKRTEPPAPAARDSAARSGASAAPRPETAPAEVTVDSDAAAPSSSGVTP